MRWKRIHSIKNYYGDAKYRFSYYLNVSFLSKIDRNERFIYYENHTDIGESEWDVQQLMGIRNAVDVGKNILVNFQNISQQMDSEERNSGNGREWFGAERITDMFGGEKQRG